MIRPVWNLLTFGSAVVGVMMACSMSHDRATVDAAPLDSAPAADSIHDAAAADPVATDLQRVRTADTDVAQLETGFSGFTDLELLVAGPFVLTDAHSRNPAHLVVASNAACTMRLGTLVTITDTSPLTGGRLFIKAGTYLCMESDGTATFVSWSGFRPYATPAATR